MRLEELARTLELDPKTCDFMQRRGFEAAEAIYTDPPAGLTAAKITGRLAELHLTFDPAPLLAAAARACQSKVLKHTFHYLSFYWWQLKDAEIYDYSLPRLTDIAGEAEGGLLDLALALDGGDAIEAKFAMMGLPREYAPAALDRIRGSVLDYGRFHDGRLGYPETQHHWMRHFVNGKLFRIGRLEYMVEPKPLMLGPAFYRRKKDGAVIGLCRSGWKLNADGFQLWRDDPSECAVREAVLEVGEHAVRGIPVDPAGFAEVRRTVTLPLDEFEPMWGENDFVPDIHIPGGGGMTPELCKASLIDAVEFFRHYFYREVKGFTSFSWIYNPDFCEVLPESNLAKFMRELYLSPVLSCGQDGLDFVFGKSDRDWTDYPANNSLQRAFHRLRESGKRLKEGGMFIEARGLAAFGTNLYRKEYRSF